MTDDRRAFFRAMVRSAAKQPEAPPEEVLPAAPPGLSDEEVERYSRQLVLPEWSEAAQLALREANVLVVGAGALGSPVASYLAGAGVGRLGIVDHDAVELSNLHRQTLHFTPDLGVPKAESAAAKLRFLNPEIVVEPYQAHFAPAMLEGADLVVDCSDSFDTRYEVNARLLRRAHPARRGRRRRPLGPRDVDPAGGERVLPLRLPGAAAARAPRRPAPRPACSAPPRASSARSRRSRR